MKDHMVSDVFDRVCATQGSRVAIRDGDHDLTFHDLLRWSQGISRVLERESVPRQPGQRVALMLPNSAAFVAAFFAIARIGGVVAPLNPHYRSQELRYYLKDIEPVALVTEPDLIAQASEVLPSLEAPPALVTASLGQDPRVLRAGTATGESVMSPNSAPLLQQYTSGSTGTPKRVVRTHAALLKEVATLQSTFGTGPDDRFLGAAPFSHVNGLVRTMMASMYVGGILHPVEGFRRRQILDLLTRERITFFGGVPHMFTILSQTPLRGDVDLSSLRTIFSSSAPLLPDDNRHFQSRYGAFIRQLYGSTETGTISFNNDPTPASCLQSVGVPLEGVRVEVIGDNGFPLPPGCEGEIAIASPFAASGYLGNLTATTESFRQGFYFSGDLGTKDKEGHITITGRKTLLLNRGGFKVNPYEVEAAIRQHPKVADVAVFGLPSQHGDDIVCCAIMASEICTAEEIISHCRSRIADFKIPARIEFRDALPKSATGKILRSELQI